MRIVSILYLVLPTFCGTRMKTINEVFRAYVHLFVNESIKLSNKICYKCAYELDQCTKFVQKYKKSHKSSKSENNALMPCCCLCLEHVEINRIFDITKDNRAIFSPLQKIRKIFNEDLKEDRDKLICLPCRYNLDVLYDLRRIFQEALINLKALINEEIDYSNFPKVYTDVVNRKTTITTFPDITFYDLINSDSENSESMAHNKRVKNRKRQPNAKRNDAKPKIRKCDECHSIVPSGTDMYRFHRTRQTVCKNCWVTMDPSKDKLRRRSRQIESNLAETKLCAVFLTDVLDKKSSKNKKEHQIEKNENNKSYVSDDTSIEDRLFESSCSSLVSKSENNIINNNTKQGKKRQIDKNEDVESTPVKVTRLSKKRANTNETKVSSDVEQQSPMTRQGQYKRTITISDSDSDVSLLKSNEKSDRTKKTGLLSPSSRKPDRKKLRTILEGVTANVRSETTDESSTEDTNVKRTTKDASNARTNKEKNIRKRKRSSSISSTEITLEEFKSPKSITSPEVKKNCHTCDTCGKKFDTKLANVEHGLTHLMQASLKLERVTVSSIKMLKMNSEEDKISKETEEASTKTASIDKHIDDSFEEIAINVVDSDDEEIFSLPKKQKENDKEAEKEANSKDCNETDKLDAENVEESTKLCVEESTKLCVEESTKIQSDEKIIEESEQSESIVVLKETVIERSKDIKETNTKNKNIRNKDTNNIGTKDKDRRTSMDRDIDASKDEDTNAQKDTSSISRFLNCNTLCTSVDVEKNNEDVTAENDTKVFTTEKDKDVTAENDTKISTTEKEKSNNEINDNKEHFHEETIHDNKVTRPSVSSINNTTKDNKNHSESCKSDLKNNSKDNESEIIEDTEMNQCDLTNKSGEENVNESEEKEKDVSSIIDETETLKNQIHLDDTVIVDENKVEETLEKQQDMTNEQNTELEIIIDVDKLNSATDTVKLDLLNGEKLNQAEDGDEDESDVVLITADSNNDIVQCAKITEETIIADSSQEKEKLEETIKNLEDLIENTTTTNNKCEERENSNLISNDSSMDAANMILKEVFDLAAAEVQKREDINNTKGLDDNEMETLENITREIRNSADMPSLDPINIMDIDDDNDITLN
ncbi:protein slender lobes isoform X2 [Camponotus floridanus]|uniref:protein slender lobes isoform X2 n=1 Tax=Camponotus floridanus TaxID=104421 RepID=UPI000DC6A803|nr:protein slender lobes isoform X2 [Camponotus floridanus]